MTCENLMNNRDATKRLLIKIDSIKDNLACLYFFKTVYCRLNKWHARKLNFQKQEISHKEYIRLNKERLLRISEVKPRDGKFFGKYSWTNSPKAYHDKDRNKYYVCWFDWYDIPASTCYRYILPKYYFCYKNQYRGLYTDAESYIKDRERADWVFHQFEIPKRCYMHVKAWKAERIYMELIWPTIMNGKTSHHELKEVLQSYLWEW